MDFSQWIFHPCLDNARENDAQVWHISAQRRACGFHVKLLASESVCNATYFIGPEVPKEAYGCKCSFE
jgi:hypothetical protein